MTVSLMSALRRRALVVDVLAGLFGLGAWLSVNAMYTQLPILVDELPESWNLASYIVVLIQAANIGGVVYGLLPRRYREERLEINAIHALMLVGCVSLLLMAFFYQEVAVVGGAPHSVALLALVFGCALLACTSSVLFVPYMRRFPASHLVSYMVGEGLSGLLPSALALGQGVGGDAVCGDGRPAAPPPAFSTRTFLLATCGLQAASAAAFALLDLLPACRRAMLTATASATTTDSTTDTTTDSTTASATNTDSTTASATTTDSTTASATTTDSTMASASTALATTTDSTTASASTASASTTDSTTASATTTDSTTDSTTASATTTDSTTASASTTDSTASPSTTGTATVEGGPETGDEATKQEAQLGRGALVGLLATQAVLMFFANGLFPSIQTYLCQPYGTTAYHFAVNLGAMANPLACYLLFFVTARKPTTIGWLAAACLAVAAYILVAATLSPSPPLVGEAAGQALVVVVWVAFSGLVSYSKLAIAAVCRNSHPDGLFWWGALTQLGSLLGAMLAFGLLNYTTAFQSPCPPRPLFIASAD